MHRKIGILLATIFGAVFIALLCSLLNYPAQAQALPRYLIIRQMFISERTDELPYTVLREMCWDDRTGYCDGVPLENPYRLYVIVDRETDLYAEVMASDSGCFVWWMEAELGEDGQPHISEVHDWIVCESSG